MKRLLVVASLSLPLATAALAGEKHRQLDAHEHGHGELSIAIDGNKVVMELESPGADIVGFEHKAKTKKQRTALANAKKMLRKISNVVTLPEAAGCALTKAKVEFHVEGDDHGHKKHGHKHKHKHSHGKHKKAEKKEETHAEFHAEYALTCKSTAKLTELAFPYFKNFKGAEELEVSIAGPKSQKKFEVERDDTSLSLTGVM